MGYIYYYDNLREHSAINYQTPFAHLKSQLPEIDDRIRFTIPIMLDKISVQLGPWSGYHVLAQHHVNYPSFVNLVKYPLPNNILLLKTIEK